MPNYLHYYYANSEFSGADFFNINKQVLLNHQIELFKKNKQNLISAANQSDEVGHTIDLLVGNKDARPFYDPPPTGDNYGGKIGFNLSDGTSLGQLAAGTNIAAQVDALIEQVSDFLTQLQSVVQKAYDNVIGKGNFRAYEQDVIQSYAATRGGISADSSIVKQNIIADFTSKAGLKSVPGVKGSSQGETSLRQMILLAYALPSYDFAANASQTYFTNSRKTIQTTNNSAEFFQVIASKISGLFNSVKGLSGEIAIERAEKALIDKLGLELAKVDRNMADEYVGGSGWLSANVNIIKDAELENLNNKDSKNISRAKGDVRVVVSDGSVNVFYSISVKDYKQPNPNASYLMPDIVKSTNFLDSARKALAGVASEDFLYQLAGGHPGHGWKSSGYRFSGAQLNSMWEELKQYVLYKNFLEYLAGLPSENVMLLVMNGQVYFIEDLLESVAANPSLLTAKFKIVKRDTMMKKNKWVGAKVGQNRNLFNAMQRSSDAIGAIYSNLNSATITVSLKILTSLAHR